MDEGARRPSSSSGKAPPTSADDTVLEFLTIDVPEHWLLLPPDDVDDDDRPQQQDQGHAAAALVGDAGGSGSGLNVNPSPPEAADDDAPRSRGGRSRRPSPRSDGAVVVMSHVEAERRRRDRLHRRFCDLRTAVPTVSGMDKASLLEDAASYIIQLRARVERLQVEVARRQHAVPGAAPTKQQQAAYPFFDDEDGLELEVRMVLAPGSSSTSTVASLRLTTAAPHAPARLMAALRALDLQVHHASVCRVAAAGVTAVQHAVVVVDVPPALRDESSLRASLLRALREESY